MRDVYKGSRDAVDHLRPVALARRQELEVVCQALHDQILQCIQVQSVGVRGSIFLHHPESRSWPGVSCARGRGGCIAGPGGVLEHDSEDVDTERLIEALEEMLEVSLRSWMVSYLSQNGSV